MLNFKNFQKLTVEYLNKTNILLKINILSRSGKIINAYNALLLAEEVSKKKKRKK